MTVSNEDFRAGMRRLGGAVNIVTSSQGDIWYGLTATAVTSLSAEPPRLLCCVNRQGVTYDAIVKSRNLCVNVLGQSHVDLAMKFAGMDGSPEMERFSIGNWDAGTTGAPRLADALVSFDCRVESILDSGSHGIVIGTIIDIAVQGKNGGEPLFYIDGAWARLTQIS